MGHKNGTERFCHRVWALTLLGVGGFLAGSFLAPLSQVHGQRAAELGTIVLENDKVIVRRYLLLPGMPTGMHTHSRDYLLVVLQGGTVKVTTPQGPNRTETLEKGTVAWRTKTTHDSENVGGGPVEALLIEIK